MPISASSPCFSEISADTGCQAWAPGVFVHRFWQPGEGMTPSPPTPAPLHQASDTVISMRICESFNSDDTKRLGT